ncbi:MAG: uracil-DNA glycosylase, partial [Methyloligellaceae bacterium]
MTAQETAATAALLAWYRDMGVDEAVADAPTDWFAVSARPPEPEQRQAARPDPVAPAARPAQPSRATSPPPASASPDEAITDARERARTAATL